MMDCKRTSSDVTTEARRRRGGIKKVAYTTVDDGRAGCLQQTVYGSVQVFDFGRRRGMEYRLNLIEMEGYQQRTVVRRGFKVRGHS